MDSDSKRFINSFLLHRDLIKVVDKKVDENEWDWLLSDLDDVIEDFQDFRTKLENMDEEQRLEWLYENELVYDLED